MSLLPSLAAQANEANQAEVLLWQARYRAIFVPLIGFSTVTLKWFGVISSESLLITRYSPRELLLAVVSLMAAYLLGHRLLVLHLQKVKRASTAIVISAIASDMLILFLGVGMMTPPEYFNRALIVAIFTVQFTQLFFGWTATLANLVLVGAGYTTLIAIANDAGRLLFPTEELWTLALYIIGALLYVALQGHGATRMNRLVEIFSKAQEGDFSNRYEEGDEKLPDPVSVIGRAYNQMRERLQAIVLTDPLSGCFNRRGLNQLAEREVARAIRQKKEIAVLAIDLDHFKRVNDEHGHPAGDAALQHCVRVWQAGLREVDQLGRLGGEEFCVLLPLGTPGDLATAATVAERLRSQLAAQPLRWKDVELKLSASFGVALPVTGDAQGEICLVRADAELYRAKAEGRNRVCTATHLLPAGTA